MNRLSFQYPQVIMNIKSKKIIAGRGFLFMPSAYVSLMLTVEHEYNHEKMINSIKKLECVHPTINDVIVRENDELWFKDVGKHVSLTTYTGSVQWTKIIKDMVSEIIDFSKVPGVRFVVFDHSDKFDILIVCHHIYGDGMSVSYIMNDLLYIYSTGLVPELRNPITELGENHLPDDKKIPADFNETLENLLEKCNKSKPFFDYDTYFEMNTKHNASVGYELISACIETVNYKKLRAKCRTLNVTINSAIATAITAVLQKDDGMEAIVPINTRSLLGFKHDKGAANFASSIRPFLTYCYDDDFWSNVIRVNNDINKAKNDVHKVLENLYSFLKLDENIFGVGYHARYGCFRDFDLVMTLRDALSLDSSKESFDISNIGKINFDNLPKDYKISNCYYIPNYTVACDCTFGSVSMNKIMSLTLSIPSTRISVEEGKEILEKVISYLVAYL